MALDDVGFNPERLAEAIHQQLGEREGPVPVTEIALALDIVAIKERPLRNLEAALVTTPERGEGEILLNLNSSAQRRRFSLGHELLHFLNPMHEQTAPDGFRCSRADMRKSGGTDRHVRQEAEANSFSIELLTPQTRLKPYLRGSPCLRNILGIAEEFDISREAAARRYVAVHPGDLAVVFCKDGQFSYAERGGEFPKLSVRNRQQIDLGNRGAGTLSNVEDVDPVDWLYPQKSGFQLSAQTLGQQAGRSMTLLRAIFPDDEDDLGIDDAYDRLEPRG
jgi:Zn-dependent peptidase ImmA (M78 family)